MDRALHLPREWTDDPNRCRAAGVPDRVSFATKITLARRVIERAVAAGVTAEWVTADAAHGSDCHLQFAPESQGLGHVLGVRTDFAVCVGCRRVRVRELLAGVPAGAWRRLSRGSGSKGPQW